MFKNNNIIESLFCSLRGLKVLLKEKSAQGELIIILFSILFCITIKPNTEFVLCILILPLIILSLEALNTAIEYTCDEITKEHSESIRKAKDLGSSAIFILLVAYFLLLIFVLWDKYSV